MNFNNFSKTTQLKQPLWTDSQKKKFKALVLVAHEKLIEAFVTVYNDKFDNDSGAFTDTDDFVSKPFLPKTKKLRYDEDFMASHFSEKYSTQDMGELPEKRLPLYVYSSSLLEGFSLHKETIPHKVLFELILSPILSTQEYDLDFPELGILLEEKRAVNSIFLNDHIIEAVREYVKSTNLFLLDYNQIEITFDLTLKEFKQRNFCPDLKNFNKRTTQVSEEDYHRLYDKHVSIYAAESITYPLQYYVFLAIFLKGLLELTIPNRSREKTTKLLLELIERAY
jgi:hypothetical protein